MSQSWDNVVSMHDHLLTDYMLTKQRRTVNREYFVSKIFHAIIFRVK